MVYLWSAALYSDVAVPMQVFSIDYCPKHSAHKLIFRTPNAIRFMCMWRVVYPIYSKAI